MFQENTFQVIITTDGTAETYAFFRYAKIEWTCSIWCGTCDPDWQCINSAIVRLLRFAVIKFTLSRFSLQVGADAGFTDTQRCIEIPESGVDITMLGLPNHTTLSKRADRENPPNGLYAVTMHKVNSPTSLSGLFSSKKLNCPSGFLLLIIWNLKKIQATLILLQRSTDYVP